MSTPTRQEIINAHKELKKLCDRVPATNRTREAILAALPPLPSVTMDEVEWDDIEHRFRVALYHDGNEKVVMLQPSFLCHKIFCLVEPLSRAPYVAELDENLLTPLGWEYNLEERS